MNNFSHFSTANESAPAHDAQPVGNQLPKTAPGSDSSLLRFGRSEAYTGKQNLDIGENVEFTYNGKARQGKVVQAPWRSKENNTVCRVECIGEEFPKTFTLDKMEFAQCSSI